MIQLSAHHTRTIGVVPLSQPLGVGQWDNPQKVGTRLGTNAGQIDLKALARKVLERDKAWDKRRTSTENSVGQNRAFCPSLLPSKTDSPALPMDWTPDTWEGRPCCYLPHTPERLRGVLLPDLQGMGIPANGLPLCLRGFSRNGWTLELADGRPALKKAHPHARNEDGAQGYLRVHAASVARAWELVSGKSR